jgi:DNA invertase Pin-like site-specific DNA recombinase
MPASFVAHYRVSTDRQGPQWLGLGSATEICRDCLNGGHIAAEFVEIETGKRNDRPELRIAVRPAALKDALKRSL